MIIVEVDPGEGDRIRIRAIDGTLVSAGDFAVLHRYNRSGGGAQECIPVAFVSSEGAAADVHSRIFNANGGSGGSAVAGKLTAGDAHNALDQVDCTALPAGFVILKP